MNHEMNHEVNHEKMNHEMNHEMKSLTLMSVVCARPLSQPPCIYCL